MSRDDLVLARWSANCLGLAQVKRKSELTHDVARLRRDVTITNAEAQLGEHYGTFLA